MDRPISRECEIRVTDANVRTVYITAMTNDARAHVNAVCPQYTNSLLWLGDNVASFVVLDTYDYDQVCEYLKQEMT